MSVPTGHVPAENRVVVHTDGACKGNPGRGGWGALLEWGDQVRELSGGERNTTNNRMELTAVIEALRAISGRSPVTIVTDSTYVKNGITTWIRNWKRNNWLTSARKPVKNKDLWLALDTEVERHDVSWEWVKGHSGHAGNERADELATAGVPH